MFLIKAFQKNVFYYFNILFSSLKYFLLQYRVSNIIIFLYKGDKQRNGSIPLALLFFFRKSRFNIKKWVATLIDQAHPLYTGSATTLGNSCCEARLIYGLTKSFL